MRPSNDKFGTGQESILAYPTAAGNDKSGPLISVITVVFNGERYIEECISSVLSQCYERTEYLVIDGGSTDKTLNVIQKYKVKISYWVSEADSGIYDAMNKGVRRATGEWICFLGADDFLYGADVLSRLSSVAQQAPPSTKIIYGDVALLSEAGDVIFAAGQSWTVAKEKLQYMMAVPHQGMLLRRSWFEQYGLFDTSYKVSGDYELLLRGWPQEDAIYVANVTVSGMRQGGLSSSPSSSILLLSEARKAQKLHLKRRIHWRMLAAIFRVYVRTAIFKIVGQSNGRRLLDIGRRCLGKAPYWTKL